METEQYQQAETMSSAQTAQEMPLRAENGDRQAEEHSWFYYAFRSFLGDATDELEKALARLQIDAANSRNMDLANMVYVKSALYKVGLELLMRKKPEVRGVADNLRTIGQRKYELQRAWEKEILAKEGEEGLKRRNQNGEGPGRQYTHDELDMDVAFTKAQVEAGILPQSALEHAIAERDAGGYYQWEKEFRKKNQEANIRELAVINHPMTGQVLENIRRLNGERYGGDYAERQHTILTELASIASQKAASTQSELPDRVTD